MTVCKDELGRPYFPVTFVEENEMRRNRQTKIVATIGPASGSYELLEQLFLKGVDVFRMNFSHGTAENQQNYYDMLREIEAGYGRPIGIIADLQGPKFRIGQFKEGHIALERGMIIRLDLDTARGNEKRINLPHPEVIEVLKEGDEFLLDDGNVRMKVRKKGHDFIEAEILSGRSLSDNKGLNLPGIVLPVTALTDKDRDDLETALDMGIGWIAQSFVQRPEDVMEAKLLIAGRAKLMIKLEKPSALEHLDEMIDIADGVMLARGDLGVEIPAENVPAVQKKVVRKTRHAGKPIVVATQMLESMIDNPRPTRAEASDVATAVYDGADAVMLSAETAIGNYPLEAVNIMNRICEKTESDDIYRKGIEADHPELENSAADAITTAAYYVARQIDAACITNYTSSGSTTVRTSRQRPAVPILCLTAHLEVARRLAIMYGVHAVHVGIMPDFNEAVKKALYYAKEQELAKEGDHLIITAGVPFGTPGSTNSLRVAKVE